MGEEAGQSRAAAGSTSLTDLAVVLGLGILLTVASSAMALQTNVVAACGVAGLIFLGAFAIGALLGFLFGVPRVLSRDSAAATPAAPAGNPAPPPGGEASKPPASQQGPVLQSNTNLERISDWLTTMIVGVTLVEFHKINGLLLGFREFLGEEARVFVVNGVPSAGVIPAVGPILLIIGAVCGFLFMYLNTRLILIKLFYQIERVLYGFSDEALDASEVKAVQATAAAAATARGGVSNFLSQIVASQKKMSVADALGVMLDALYQPDGHRTVIKLAGDLANSAAVRRADYWYYLAAAFGQQHQEAAARGDREAMQSARDNALDAARRAVAIDPAYRARLRELTNEGSIDNDLSSLSDDPELARLLRG